jgi:hypothetical protein
VAIAKRVNETFFITAITAVIMFDPFMSDIFDYIIYHIQQKTGFQRTNKNDPKAFYARKEE